MKRMIYAALALATGMSISFQAWTAQPEFPKGKPFQAIESSLATVIDELGTIKDDIDALDSKLDTIIAGIGGNDPLVPFIVMDSTGGVCNSASKNSSNPEIIIESDGGEDNFVVTSVLLKTAYSEVCGTDVHLQQVASGNP